MICEQYLETLEQMQAMDMEIASSFIVMAAQLIYIKSKTLLPAENPEEPEEDPREALQQALNALASLAGAWLYWQMVHIFPASPVAASILSILLVFTIRMLATCFRWNLPKAITKEL